MCHHRSPDPWWLGVPFLFSDTISLITQASFFSKLFKSLLEGLNWAVIPPFCPRSSRDSPNIWEERLATFLSPPPWHTLGARSVSDSPAGHVCSSDSISPLPPWAWNAYSLWACTWCLGCPNRSIYWASLTCLQTYLGVYISGTPWSIPLEIVPGF